MSLEDNIDTYTNDTENGDYFKSGLYQSTPLGLEEVRDLLYIGTRPIKEKKPPQNEEVEEWNLRMKCFQDWFIRCSWTNKFLFLEILCYSTEGCFVMENILRAIDNVFTKDVVESLSSDFTAYDYDRILADDNRALDRNCLKRTMKKDFFWFVSLEPAFQARVILKLLRLGGGGLVLNLYKTASNVFKERQSIYWLLNNIPQEKNYRRPSSQVTLSNDVRNSTVSGNTLKKFDQLQRWQEELSCYKKYKKLSVDEKISTKKGEASELLDYLQLLPMGLNRKIISFVDGKTLPNLKKVGKYWSKMIDESINEMSGRKAINGKINKISEIKFEKTEEKSSEILGENEGEFEYIVVSKKKTLINKKINTEKDGFNSWRTYERVFSKKFFLKELEKYPYKGRLCAVDTVVGTLACSSPDNVVNFYSVRTGDKLNFTALGFETSITSIALHPNRNQIFIGCRNGSITLRDIRSNRKTGFFAKHPKAVTSLVVTEMSLLSLFEDDTIKLFQLWSGVCLLCVDLSNQFNISCALLTSDEPQLSAIGTREGVLVVINVNTKRYLNKVQLHKAEITEVAHDGDILVTGSDDGKIRIWDLKNLNQNLYILKPFYNINVGSPVRSLTLHKNQIFTGCDNGTLKIISLVTGKVFKVMKISSQIPILGLAITEGKFSLKLVMWHEGGIEVRTFSPIKPFRDKPKGKKHKEWKETALNTKISSDIVFAGFAKTVRESIVSWKKKTTFFSNSIPFEARGCTLPALREHQKNAELFKSNAYTRMMNQTFTLPFLVETFPRYKNFISNKK